MSDITELLSRLEDSQKACFDVGQHIAAMDIQTARAELSRLAALPAPDGVEGWQPIETAPKDGTEVLVYHPEAGVCAAFCPVEGFSWHCMDGSNTTIGSKSGASIPCMTSFIEDPTHWQPLPAPPPILAKPAQEGQGS